MGQGKDDSDYKKLPDVPKDAKHGFDENKDEKEPWVWFFTVVMCFFLTTGLAPSTTLFIQAFARAGVCSSFCPNGENQCDNSTLMVGNVFTVANYASQLIAMPTGVLFDRAGGKLTTMIGACTITGSWLLMVVPVRGAANGNDGVTWLLFAAAVISNFCGFRLTCAGLACTLYWLHKYISLAFTMYTTALTLSSVLALAILPQVTAGVIPLATVLIGFFTSHCIGSVGFLFLLPTKKEYEIQAEEVTGVPMKGGASSVLQVLSLGCRVLRANFFDHVFFLFTLCVGYLWAQVYNGLSPQYMVALIDDPSMSEEDIISRQANDVTISSNIMAVGVAPMIAYLSERVGAKFYPLAYTVLACVAVLLMPVASLNAHFVVAGISTYMSTTCPTLVSTRSFVYASSSRVGTVQGILNSMLAVMGLPMALGAQAYLSSLQNPRTRYEPFYLLMVSAGLVGFIFFCTQAFVGGTPKSPVLLREDEMDICMSYGCKYLSEVMYVLNLKDQAMLLSLLSSSDPDTQVNLVMHINVNRLTEKLMDRDVEEIIACIQSGIAWRRKTALADQGAGLSFSIGGMGSGVGNLAKMLKVDTSRFGTGQAKTMDDFEAEVSRGRSKLVLDEKDPSKMKRLVALVVLRIWTGNDSSKMLMVQMSEQFPDGRARFKPQLPGVKRGANDTVKDCVAATLDKYNMDKLGLIFLYDRTEVTEETQESPSYPGVFTVYQKEFVDGYFTESNQSSLQQVGLPLEVAWSTYHEKSRYTYLCEWLPEHQAIEKGIQVSGKLASSNRRQTPAAAEMPAISAKIKTPKEILRSLEARDYSKKLLFMIHMEDADELEQWLLTENVNNLREAFLDLENWPDADPGAMYKKFESLVSEETMSDLMRSRPTLKPLVIDLLKSELMKVQSENADKKKDLANMAEV